MDEPNTNATPGPTVVAAKRIPTKATQQLSALTEKRTPGSLFALMNWNNRAFAWDSARLPNNDWTGPLLRMPGDEGPNHLPIPSGDS